MIDQALSGLSCRENWIAKASAGWIRTGELPHPRSAAGGWLSISRSLLAARARTRTCTA